MKRKILLMALSVLFVMPGGLVHAEEGIRTPVSAEEKGQFPYNMTYAWNIQKEGAPKMRCSGTLIGGNWFLSAGHCVTKPDGNYGSWNKAESEVNGGTHNLSMKMYKKNVFVKTPFKVMPGYAGYNDLKNDVSVTKVIEPGNLNTPPVPLKIYRNLSELVGKTVSTMGYSRYYRGDYTQTSGKVVAVEEDGTLTVNMPVAQENSGSPVYLNGEIIGVLTAIGPGSDGFMMGDTATVTPLTEEIKRKLLDPNGISSTVQ